MDQEPVFASESASASKAESRAISSILDRLSVCLHTQPLMAGLLAVAALHVAVARSFAALISSWYNYAHSSSALCQHMLLCFYTTILLNNYASIIRQRLLM